MIQNWNRHNLNMDFGSILAPKGKPSDIDMFYISHNYVILGEIKNEMGVFNDSQRNLYIELLNSTNKKYGIVMFITHDKSVENGDRMVDVASCKVAEYYLKGDNQWRVPKKEITVQNIFLYARRKWL